MILNFTSHHKPRERCKMPRLYLKAKLSCLQNCFQIAMYFLRVQKKKNNIFNNAVIV